MSFTDPVLESDSLTHQRLTLNALQTKTKSEEFYLRSNTFSASGLTTVTFSTLINDSTGTINALLPGTSFPLPWAITGTDGAKYLEIELYATWTGMGMVDEMDPNSYITFKVYDGAFATHLLQQPHIAVNEYPNSIGTPVYRSVITSLAINTPIVVQVFPVNVVISNAKIYLKVTKTW